MVPGQVRGGALSLLTEAVTLVKLDNYLRYKIYYAQDIQWEFADRRRSPAPVF